MMNKRLFIASLVGILILVLTVGAIFLLTNREPPNTPDLPVPPVHTEQTEIRIPSIDPPNESIKVEDETKPGISSTPFVDIEEGNEIYYDSDVIEKLSLIHEEGDEDLVNNMLDWITGFINYFASKGYSHTAICQIQRLFLITSEEMMTLDVDIARLNITRCISPTGATEAGFENEVYMAFGWTTPYDYSYVFDVEVGE